MLYTRGFGCNGGLHLYCIIHPAGGRPEHVRLRCYFKSMPHLFHEVFQSSLFVQLQCFITESGVLLPSYRSSIQNALCFSLLLSFFFNGERHLFPLLLLIVISSHLTRLLPFLRACLSTGSQKKSENPALQVNSLQIKKLKCGLERHYTLQS